MSALTGLDPQFAEGNVTLAVVLGAIGTLSTVRALLPEPEAHTIPTRDQLEPSDSDDRFVAMLLGAIALHDRLTTLVDAPAGHDADAPAIPLRATAAPREGLLR